MGLGGGGGGEGGSLGMETVSRVLIPNCKIGAVIGKGGAIIKHIREVSGLVCVAADQVVSRIMRAVAVAQRWQKTVSFITIICRTQGWF